MPVAFAGAGRPRRVDHPPPLAFNTAMQVIRSIAGIRAAVAAARATGRTIAFVPTMGALHAGHVSLVRAAARDGAFVVVSIFVNPTQFGPNEDFSRYPRDEPGDLDKCRRAGAHALFLPATEEIYPPGASTVVHVGGVTDGLCGPHRPGHFDGVATVVAKLFNIVGPDRAYFGEKDFQQLVVVRRMTADLNLPVEIVGCPTVREPDGLAMSSRNAYLSADERLRATAIHRSLALIAAVVAAGERDTGRLVARAREALEREARPDKIDYFSAVDPESLREVPAVGGPTLFAVALRIGRTRLIDNVLVRPQPPSASAGEHV